MSLSITDAMQQAQDAISGGNYRAAVTTCSRLVKQFPAYAAAHRLLGEAYLEQSQSADAERAFSAALAGNPRQPFAYLGLGLLAEDRGATDTALAYCQVAWELSPQLAQLREPVVRVSTRRYGADGQLQLTRAALAQLHANASRLRRAANEYRAALADLPERIDLKLGLAETLWRLGANAEAASLAAQALEQQPEAVQALVIQTDLERRTGAAGRADALLARLRAVDPDGELTEGMLAGHAQADRDYLLVAADAVPLVSEQLDAVVAERPHIAPAPDFDYVPSRPEAPLPGLDDLEPISVEEFGAVDGETTAVTTASVENDVFADLGSMGFEDFSEEPFDPNEPMPAFEAATTAAPAADVVLDDDLSALAAALEGDVADAVARAGAPAMSDAQELEPFDFAMFDQPGAGAADAPTTFSAPSDFEDFSSDETALEQALPPTEAPRGYTTVLRELDDAGLAPFDALNRESPASTSAAINHAQPAELPAADALSSDTDELTRMNQQWDSIDAEIQNAVPWEVQRGFTDQLRSLEEIGLAPFEFEDEETTGAEPSAPAAAPLMAAATQPEAAPVGADALAEAQPAAEPEFEATPAATPEVDATLEIDAQPATDAVAVDADANVAADADDASFGDLQPFVFEDFEQAEGARAATSQLFGEHGSKSVVPSDADLEALLAIEDEPFLDAEPEPARLAEATPEAVATGQPTAEEATAAAEPVAEPDEFEQFLHSTMAATRALPADQAPPALTEEDLEPAAHADTLATTDSLYDRARAAKDQLVADGVITGDREFESAPESAVEPAAEPAQALRLVEDDAQQADDEEYATLTTGASRDTGTLRAALIADPHDSELHWWLAEALRERGDTGDALSEYRWVIRHAPERHDAVLRALTECVEHGQQPDMAHRLLADIYRRRGDVARASNHAALALQQRQRDTRQ